MQIVLWGGFLLLVAALLFLDLGVFHRKAHVIGAREALLWTLFWITLAHLFTVFVYFAYNLHWFGIGVHVGHSVAGHEAALKYLTGYVIEKSLSIDNIFVIAMIFSFFRVPGELQHRVLFWGIVGALVLRGLMIAGGVALLTMFSWMVYVFGIFLIITAVKMLITRHDNLEPNRNPIVRFVRKVYPITPGYEGTHFFSTVNGQKAITPLFLVLLVIESTDVLFAVDSIPAILAVTTDPFIVFTSNVFAILGLRSLYFALAAVMDRFHYLKMSLVFLLAFVGVKMLLSNVYHIPTLVSLAIIAGILAVGIAASLLYSTRDTIPLQKPVDVPPRSRKGDSPD